MPMMADGVWQMSLGERAALEGLLSDLRPRLAIEIGTAEGGSLARIAEHVEEVHSFDVVDPAPHVRELANVTFHKGDNHELLPRLLERLASEGRIVEFALVDGDHSAEGVRADVHDLLSSPAVAGTVIVLHDTSNPTVRAGLESVDYAAYGKVRYVELDLLSGYQFTDPSLGDEAWGGLGLIYAGDAPAAELLTQDRYQPAADTLQAVSELKSVLGVESASELPAAAREVVAELARLRAEHAALQGDFAAITSSPSWRITRPLRAAKRALLRRS